jgi:16S rRNA processing protein RimM
MPLWKPEKPVHIGKIIKPHSYLGFVKVAFLFSGLEGALVKGSYLYVLQNKKPVPYFIEDIQWLEEKAALIKLADIIDDKEAARLRDKEIVLPAELIGEAEEEEPEGAALIGFKVEDMEGNALGEITDIIEGPQNLLQAVYRGRQYFIPFHPDLVKKVMAKKKVVRVDLPEGLVDL